MATKKSVNSMCVCLMVCVLLSGVWGFATSVYTIGHGQFSMWVYKCPLNAFDIVNDQIVYRDSIILDMHGVGGIALAMDELTNTLFVTYEAGEYGGGNVLDLVDSQTFAHKEVTVAGVTNLTGIVFDPARRKLYATDRNTDKLHILGYNPISQTVWLERTVHLANIDYGCGLALNGDLLYVSEFYYAVNHQENMVYYSDVNCYRISEDFAFVETIDMGDKTVAIDYTPTGNLLYGGAYAYDGSYQHLIKKSLNPAGSIQKDIDTGVIGVACDDTAAGRVFLTTYRNDGSIEMWDTANWGSGANEPPVLEATDIYDDPDQEEADLRNLAGIITAETFKPSMIAIIKTNNVAGCISPESEDPNFVYTIAISDPNNDGHTNVWVVDHLPREVDFVSASPADSNFGWDEESRTYTWYLPYLEGYDPNTLPPGNDPNEYFSLIVRVNEWAEPLSSFVNVVDVQSDTSDGWAAIETETCDWGGPIIYVRQGATGLCTGVSWSDAYNNLPSALSRAAQSGGAEVWVAEATYRPADTVLTETFLIPSSTSVYGGFSGTETSRDERNWKLHPTTLSGFIKIVNYGYGDIELLEDTVVTMDGNNSLLDGFTVEKAAQKGIKGSSATVANCTIINSLQSGVYSSGGELTLQNCRIAENNNYGVYGSGSDFTLENCIVENNEQYGIYAQNGDVTLKWCKISDNNYQGILHQGNGKVLTIENSKIHNNQYDGIRTENSNSTILNSLIYQNGSGSTLYNKYYGVNLVNPSESPTTRNNTIVQNVNEAIRFVGSNAPTVKNNILYYNNDEEQNKPQLDGISSFDHCCIYSSTDPNGVNTTPDGNGNLTCKPGFAYALPDGLPDPNDTLYHIAYNSPCVDAGDSASYTSETDIDGEPRVYGVKVDVGADEAYSCDDNLSADDIYNPLDRNADGIVNYKEYARFAKAWLSHDPEEPGLDDPNLAENWDPVWNLDAAENTDTEFVIDLADFEIFCANWLWTSCWRQSQFDMYGTYSMMMGMGGGEQMLSMQEIIIPAQAGIQQVPKKSIEEKILDMQYIVEFLEKIWLEEPDIQQKIAPEDWQEFMDSLNEYLTNLQSENPAMD